MVHPKCCDSSLPLFMLALMLSMLSMGIAGPATGLAGTTIATDVISSAGGTSTSIAPGTIRLSDTFGQGPIGAVATGTTVKLQDGFWATISAKGAAEDTTPPGPVASFEAFPGDTCIGLGWTNPSDADFAGILIRFSTAGYPATPADGAEVPNGNSGEFWNLPGVGDDWVHQGLTNGTTYYYVVFAFDSTRNYSTGVGINAAPLDTVPPTAVTAFTATAGDTTVVLRWTNPDDTDFDHALIRFATDHAPSNRTQGSPVPNGNNGMFLNAPASVDSFVHTQLTNGVTYYYSIWCGDEVPNYSGYWDAIATPEDITPPGLVDYFTATAGERQVMLRWKNPPDADLKEVSIRYSTTSTPQTPTQGSPVENGSNGKFPATPAAVDSFVHTNLVPDVAYFYSVIALDQAGNYLSYTPASAIPFDNTPPEIAISVFQNPYLTNHLDVYLIASEAVLDTSVVLAVGETDLVLEESDADQYVWRGDYDLCCTGPLTIAGCARNISFLYGCKERGFSSSLLLASSGGMAWSVDGQFELSMAGGAIKRDAYVLVFESPGRVAGTGTVYEVTPSALELGGFVEIGIAYSDTSRAPEHFCVASLDGERATPVDSYLDRKKGRVIAYVDKLGAYGLLWRPDTATPAYGEGGFRVLQNIPNPFVGTTSIGFEVPLRGRVRIDIVGVDGRVVRTLLDDAVTPGKHSVGWDGRDDGGRTVAGGVYVCKARFGSETITHKLVHMR